MMLERTPKKIEGKTYDKGLESPYNVDSQLRQRRVSIFD
jgi:hypothetical protein